MSQATPAKKASEQVAARQASPQREHQWLQQLVGDWTFQALSPDGAGHDIEDAGGTEHVRMLGEVWLVAEGQGAMPDGSRAFTLMTIGYDSNTKRFVGSWIGSMMTEQWLYDGELDAAARVLTLNSQGPSMSGDGSRADYRDTLEIEGPDSRILTASTRGKDGHWHVFSKARYQRVKR